MGSSSTGRPRSIASRSARVPAVWKARSDESTSWNLPSTKPDLEIDHRLLGIGSFAQRLEDARLHRRDVLPRDGAAGDLVLKDKAPALLERLHFDLDHRELAVTAGLLDQTPDHDTGRVIVSQ